MEKLEKLAKTLGALGHPLRLRIIALLGGGEMYLSEIANHLGVSRALTKIHLKKLEKNGLVRSKIVLVEGEARALRYYNLRDFDIHVTPKLLAEMRGD
jgi:ArsR family transcriptional regulator